jgi:hypothetical protein
MAQHKAYHAVLTWQMKKALAVIMQKDYMSTDVETSGSPVGNAIGEVNLKK